MKSNAVPARWRRIRRFSPRLAYINKPATYPVPGAGASGSRVSNAEPFVPDGFNFPRPQDTKFDAIIRIPTIAAAATVTQNIFTQEENIKAGWIRGLGYGFNNPNGFFQVRTTLLINGSVAPGYIFKTVDAATGDYQGSLPTVQIGTVQNPTDVYIALPANAQVSVRLVNNSTTEAFSFAMRLTGWSYAV